MFKKTSKLVGLLLLLVISFVYTDRVFNSARASDPVMMKVIEYKKKHDIMPKEPVITDDELILGTSGLIINTKKSYNNMKENDVFDESKIVYESKLPNATISNTYNYYIKQGNKTKKQVTLVVTIDEEGKNLDKLLEMVAKYNVPVSFFVDGYWLESNVENAFSIINLGCGLYNLGYQGSYDKKMIGITNNLIESISLKDSNFCLNNNKNDEAKNICEGKKMHTLTSTLIDPDISSLKNSLVSGAIISYSSNNFDLSKFGLIINTITSRGYKIVDLSDLIKE